MSELYFSDGVSSRNNFTPRSEVSVPFLLHQDDQGVEHSPIRLAVGKGETLRPRGRATPKEQVGLDSGVVLTPAGYLRGSQRNRRLLEFVHNLEPIPDMLFQSEQLRTTEHHTDLEHLEEIRNTSAGQNSIYLSQFEQQMMDRQKQSAAISVRLFNQIEDQGYEMWLRLEASQNADPVLRGKIIMAKFALLRMEQEDGRNLIPVIFSRDENYMGDIPQQLILSPQWLYIKTAL